MLSPVQEATVRIVPGQSWIDIPTGAVNRLDSSWIGGIIDGTSGYGHDLHFNSFDTIDDCLKSVVQNIGDFESE